MGRRVGGEGYVVPLGSTPLPHHAAPVCHPVPLRRVLSRALRHRLPIATSCSLAYVPPVWSCPRPHPPLPSCVPHVAPAPPLAVAPVRPEAATAPFGIAHLRAPPPSLPRPSAVRSMAAWRLLDRSPCVSPYRARSSVLHVSLCSFAPCGRAVARGPRRTGLHSLHLLAHSSRILPGCRHASSVCRPPLPMFPGHLPFVPQTYIGCRQPAPPVDGAARRLARAGARGVVLRTARRLRWRMCSDGGGWLRRLRRGAHKSATRIGRWRAGDC